ncbi:ribosomal RNA small subunit methyltransferase A [bacterium]|nr:ribosomal RNA small subunit methyltransferase A [bacterium]
MKAKKHFGQHFLYHPETAMRIVDALGDVGDKNVLEVGPGKGVLSQFLYEKSKAFKAVEIDPEAAEYVQDKFEGIDIILKDFLKLDLSTVFDTPFQLIGNFPYNISSQIVFRIIEQSEWVESWVGMFQLEMGQRLIASPHSKEYGILSVIVPFYYKLEKVMILPPGAFQPPPKVKSIVLKATRVDHQFKCDPKLLHKVVKTAFNQRRKVLSNSLSSILPKETLNQSQFANLRPENLTTEDFESLSSFIEGHVSN